MACLKLCERPVKCTSKPETKPMNTKLVCILHVSDRDEGRLYQTYHIAVLAVTKTDVTAGNALEEECTARAHTLRTASASPNIGYAGRTCFFVIFKRAPIVFFLYWQTHRVAYTGAAFKRKKNRVIDCFKLRVTTQCVLYVRLPAVKINAAGQPSHIPLGPQIFQIEIPALTNILGIDRRSSAFLDSEVKNEPAILYLSVCVSLISIEQNSHYPCTMSRRMT